MAHLAYPTVNMSGTMKVALVQGYVDAMEAIHTALVVVRKVAPNGRDYPTHEPSYTDAHLQHLDRIRRLERIISELQVVAEMVDRQEGP